MENFGYCSTPVGTLLIVEEAGALVRLDFCPDPGSAAPAKTPFIREVTRQLEEYFAGRRKNFDLPLLLRGTPFQQSVWQALREIPYGQTRSYKEIAEKIGRPAAVRAVGQANHTNPVAIVVPCHRVVGADGSLTGYAGGLWIKEYLLEMEKRYV